MVKDPVQYNKAGQLALYIGSVWLGSVPVVTARLGFGSAKTDLPKQDEPSRAKPFSRLSHGSSCGLIPFLDV
jgi:hypothetical protein